MHRPLLRHQHTACPSPSGRVCNSGYSRVVSPHKASSFQSPATQAIERPRTEKSRMSTFYPSTVISNVLVANENGFLKGGCHSPRYEYPPSLQIRQSVCSNFSIFSACTFQRAFNAYKTPKNSKDASYKGP